VDDRGAYSGDMKKPIVILGCTASGKSDLGERIAQRLGEKRHGGQGAPATVMAADSMQVYRGMDIGTAKPTPEVRTRIPYLMVDVADPWEVYSAAKFVAAARPMVEATQRENKPQVIVGGTILYLRSLIDGMFEGPGADEAIRAELAARADKEGSAVLHAELAKVDPAAAGRIHPNDLRRIVRGLEVHRLTGAPITQLQTQWTAAHPAVDALFIGIQREKDLLGRRINARVRKMVDAGLVEEVRRLINDPRGFSQEAASGVGYKEIREYLEGRATLDEALEQIKIQTRYLAKMQRTWMKRWPAPGKVCWLTAAEGVEGGDLLDAALRVIAPAIE
jgi:tRNA dimethylallyltransferase